MVDDKNPVNHIGVIIDGNRRYAKVRGMLSHKGHEKGADKVEDFLKWCEELKINELTIYALSTENLNRDKKELDFLFDLFRKWFKKLNNDKEIEKNQVKIRFIGDLSLVPEDIKEICLNLEEKTKKYNKYMFNFCFAYGGRQELTAAVNKLIKSGKKQVTESDITNALWLSSEPQFIIRTGGKTRSSNFLPWQSVYSEWFFLDKMWPEIEKSDLVECIEKFQKTQRNFGK
ncbi:MAG: polyprenyl diphosphate synthase [Nanoarchaeota archaeon]